MFNRLIRQKRLVFWVGTLLIFLQAYRVPVIAMNVGVDGSFPHILNMAAFTSAKFGRDVIYTYGPLGFLLAIEDVRSHLPIGLLFWAAGYGILAAAMSYLVVKQAEGRSLVIGLVAAAVVASLVDADRLIICLTMLLLFISYEEPRYRNALIAACAALAAIGLLMKVTIGVGCIAAILASLLVPLTPLRETVTRAAIALSVAVIGSYFLWTVSSGSFEGIFPYFYNSFQMSAGYTATMSSGRAQEWLSLTLFLLAILSLMIAAALLPRWKNLHSVFVLAPTVAVAWKHGVVRYDGHIIALVTVLIFAIFCVSILHLRDRSLGRSVPAGFPLRSVSVLSATPVVTFTALALIVSGLWTVQYTYAAGLAGGLRTTVSALRYSKYRKNFKLLSYEYLSGHRLGPELLDRIGDKTTDIYSYDLGFMAANPGVNWKLKPIFQHFNAFTDHLDRLNANFLAGPDKPDFILMHHPGFASILGVDGRHQLFDDPIAFLQLMRSYRTAFVEHDIAKPQVGLLERSENQRFGQPTVFGTKTVQWNKAIPLPATGASAILRAKVELSKPVPSRVKEALFRISPIYLTYILADGTEQKYRLMPTHLESGVWINPLFENYWQLYSFLGREDWTGARIVAIRFEADNPADYGPSLSLAWEKIDCYESAPCEPKELRVYAAAADGRVRRPVQIGGPTTVNASLAVPVARAVEVRLSTYAKVNKGVLTVEALDADGKVLGAATHDASSVVDNGYAMFVFDRPIRFPDGKAVFRLSYAAEAGGTLAAWRSSPAAEDFDFRVYTAATGSDGTD